MSDSITKWLASDLSGKKLKVLEEVRILLDKDLIKWRFAAGEHFLSHKEGEIPVFLAYIECKFRLPVHLFLPRVLEFYGVELVNLASNYIANLRMAGSAKLAAGPGECSLRLHDGKADENIQMYLKSS